MDKYQKILDKMYKEYDEYCHCPLSAALYGLTVKDVEQRLIEYSVRIRKAQLIVNPKFHLSITTNHKSWKLDNKYLTAKVYWVDIHNGTKRILSFSLGNMINYPMGHKSPETIEIAGKEIQEILYKKFGNVI